MADNNMGLPPINVGGTKKPTERKTTRKTESILARMPRVRTATGGTKSGLLARLKNLSKKDLAYMVSAASVVVSLPVAEHYMSKPSANTLKPGFSTRAATGTGEVFEPGAGGFAPGSGVGTDVITPLSARDPSSLILGSGGEQNSTPDASASMSGSMPSSSSEDNSGFRDTVRNGASAGMSAAVQSASPTTVPKMASALRGFGAAGAGSSGASDRLFGLGLINAAKSAPSRAADREMVNPIASAGYKGATTSDKSGSGDAYEKLRAKSGNAADMMNAGRAMDSLEKAAAASVTVGDGSGMSGASSGGTGEAFKNPSGEGYKNTRSYQPVVDYKEQMRRDWEKFFKVTLPMQAINKFTEPMMKVVGKGSEWLFCQNEGKDEKRKKGCLCNAEAPAVGPSGGKEGWLGCQKQIWDVKKDGDTYTLVKLREAPVYYKDYITDSDDGKKTLDSFTSEGCSVVETDPDAPKKTVGNLCNVIKNVNATSKRRRNLRKHGTGLKPDTEAMLSSYLKNYGDAMRIMRRIDSERPGSVDKDWRIVSEAVSYADAMQKQLVAISQNELNDVAGNNGGNGKLYDDINAVTFTKPDFSSLRTSVNTTLQGALSKQVTIRRKTAETKSVLEWYAVIDNKCQTATNAQVTALCADLGKTLVVPAGAEAILKDIDTRSADYAKVIDMEGRIKDSMLGSAQRLAGDLGDVYKAADAVRTPPAAGSDGAYINALRNHFTKTLGGEDKGGPATTASIVLPKANDFRAVPYSGKMSVYDNLIANIGPGTSGIVESWDAYKPSRLLGDSKANVSDFPVGKDFTTSEMDALYENLSKESEEVAKQFASYSAIKQSDADKLSESLLSQLSNKLTPLLGESAIFDDSTAPAPAAKKPAVAHKKAPVVRRTSASSVSATAKATEKARLQHELDLAREQFTYNKCKQGEVLPRGHFCIEQARRIATIKEQLSKMK